MMNKRISKRKDLLEKYYLRLKAKLKYCPTHSYKDLLKYTNLEDDYQKIKMLHIQDIIKITQVL